jgi:hypothetical protein
MTKFDALLGYMHLIAPQVNAFPQDQQMAAFRKHMDRFEESWAAHRRAPKLLEAVDDTSGDVS